MEFHKDQSLDLYYIYCTLHLLEILSEVMAQTFILTQLYHYLASESTMEAKLGALAQIEMCAEEIETER